MTTQARPTDTASGATPARGWPSLERADRRGLQGLLGLALLAFAIRFIGLAIGGGFDSKLGLDDATYFTGAISFLEGRLPYRDFNILHPPGILYVLSPFAFMAGVTDETTGFALARFSFMVLGAINTFLVGLVGRRIGWGTALCAAAMYAVWLVPVQWERATYLIAPQVTVMLLALLQLTGRGVDDLTTRRVSLAGVFIGLSGVLQVWAALPATVILLWLLVTCRSRPRVAVRLAATYVLAGTATALALLAPFLLTTGPRMIQMIIFAQASRTGTSSPPWMERLPVMEGLPTGALARFFPDALVLGVAILAVALTLYVAWRRPAIWLWVAVAAVEIWFVMITPRFLLHYAGWPAPLEALCLGSVAAYVIELATRRRRWPFIAAYAVLLVGLSMASLIPAGRRLPINAERPDLSTARCVTADEGLLLIKTHTLIRSLRNDCRLLPNPRSISHFNNAVRSGEDLSRGLQPEYQQGSIEYYSSGDIAMFNKLELDAFSDETWAAIRAALPHEEQVGKVLVLRKVAP